MVLRVGDDGDGCEPGGPGADLRTFRPARGGPPPGPGGAGLGPGAVQAASSRTMAAGSTSRTRPVGGAVLRGVAALAGWLPPIRGPTVDRSWCSRLPRGAGSRRDDGPAGADRVRARGRSSCRWLRRDPRRRRNGSNAGFGSGGANRKPWARSQPHSSRNSRCRSCSSAFGHRDDSQVVRERHDRAGDGFGTVVGEVADEAPVDLEGVQRQLVQVGQRRVAGAEVVDADVNAELGRAGGVGRRRCAGRRRGATR